MHRHKDEPGSSLLCSGLASDKPLNSTKKIYYWNQPSWILLHHLTSSLKQHSPNTCSLLRCFYIGLFSAWTPAKIWTENNKYYTHNLVSAQRFTFDTQPILPYSSLCYSDAMKHFNQFPLSVNRAPSTNSNTLVTIQTEISLPHHSPTLQTEHK